MKHHLYRSFQLVFITLFTTLFLSSCNDEDVAPVERHLGFKEFVPQYNQYIKSWLKKEHARVSKSLAELEEKLASAEGEEKKDIENTISDTRRELARIEFRQQVGDYFAFKKESDLPQDLVWEDGMDQPEIGDPRAIKGGRFNLYIPNFPPTVRQFGREANNSFRGELYDNLEISLVNSHPLTGKIIPGTARKWAVSKDGRTVFFELDPDVTFNDGHPVKVVDYMVSIYLRVSDNVLAPFQKQYYREQFAQVAAYGEKYLAVTLPESKPLMPMYAALSPAPSHFYKNYGPDFVDRYQWKVAPTTGAYYVKDKDIKKGVSITLTRDKNWWAKDKKYYRYRFNPDKITYTTIRDASKAFELFRAGQLDVFHLTQPKLWYEKSEIEPVFKGYIERYKFYNQYPRSPRGVYINLANAKLQNLQLRKGICHALNWQRCIDVIFRGDYTRLQQISEGFGIFTNPNIKAREFSVIKARKFFKQAGYTKEGKDGILRKPSGERLAVSLSYANASYYPRLVAILKEEAKKAGLELHADGMEPTVVYKKVMKKEHEMAIWSWSTNPPFPRYYQGFYSKNAFLPNGQPKPQTNNINSYANPKMDKYCKAIRYARTTEEVRKNAWAAQQLIFDEALFSPAWTVNYNRMGSWRWVRWPDTKDTPFSPPIVYEPLETYCLWIDNAIKEETKKAMKSGKTFPEVQREIDNFKDGIPQQMKTLERQKTTSPEKTTPETSDTPQENQQAKKEVKQP